MVLGTPQTTFQGQTRKLSPMARASDHFGELEGSGVKADHVRRALDARFSILPDGTLELAEREYNVIVPPATKEAGVAQGIVDTFRSRASH